MSEDVKKISLFVWECPYCGYRICGYNSIAEELEKEVQNHLKSCKKRKWFVRLRRIAIVLSITSIFMSTIAVVLNNVLHATYFLVAATLLALVSREG